MNKLQRSGFFVLVSLIILTEIIIRVDFFETNEKKQYSFTEEELSILSEIQPTKKINEKVTLFEFNPNSLDEKGFVKLGFSDKQAQNIIKNRYRLGGNFSNIKEFSETYVISDKKLEELKPYIKLSLVKPTKKHKSQKQTNKFSKVNPNNLDINGWINFGFSEKQAKSILKYKNSLPSKLFENLAQIKAAYVINEWKFNQIKPYLKLEKTNKKIEVKENIATQLYANKMKEKDWIKIGFTTDESKNIINCKNFKIKFKDIEDMKKCPKINLEKLQKISEKLIF